MAGKNSRTKNTFYNFSTGIGAYVLQFLLQFIIRTAFIKTLGKQYLGIEGLFSNILMMLSLVELGVGNAVLYKLYEPIANDDHHRIAVLMHFYQKMYRIIGAAVALMGLCLIPFLPFLIEDYDTLGSLGINAGLIFSFYLFKTFASYSFFVYKAAIIKANQKEYIINFVNYFCMIFIGILQIVCLFVFKNFVLYVLLSIAQVIIENFIYAIISDRMYPYIKEHAGEQLDKQEVKEIFSDCGALFLYKLNNAIVKGTDSIVLSAFLGLGMVAMYANYLVFRSAFASLFNKVFDSVGHSIGDLHTTHNVEHEYEVFQSISLITGIIGGTVWIGVFVVADELIQAWIGSSWVIPQPFALLMGMELFTLAARLALSKYRIAMGLFQQAKYRPLAGIIINLGLSVLLVNYWGITGVLVGTVVADWTTFMWFDPIIIHKHGFKNYKPVSLYFKKLALQVIVLSLVGAVDFYICKHFFTGYGWLSVLIHSVICGLSVPVSLLVAFYPTQEGQYVRGIMKKYSSKILKKMGG